MWGTAPASLRWLDVPPIPALALANDLLRRLGAVEGSKVLRDEGSREIFGEEINNQVEAIGSAETSAVPVSPFTSSPNPFITQSLHHPPQPTAHGRALARLGLAPRLGHLVVRGHELGHGPAAATLAALLSERDVLRAGDAQDARV